MNGALDEHAIELAATLYDDDELVCVANWHHQRAAGHEQQAKKVVEQQSTGRTLRGIRMYDKVCSQKQDAETQ